MESMGAKQKGNKGEMGKIIFLKHTFYADVHIRLHTDDQLRKESTFISCEEYFWPLRRGGKEVTLCF